MANSTLVRSSGGWHKYWVSAPYPRPMCTICSTTCVGAMGVILPPFTTNKTTCHHDQSTEQLQ